MTIKIIGIAGGSGSGKSTLTNKLREIYDDITVLHFDDYQKKREQIPKIGKFDNWDHPDCIDFTQLQSDLKDLKLGKSINIMTKDRYINPNYEKQGRIPYTIKPKKIIIVEGYMILHKTEIREILDTKIYLNLDIKCSIHRRDKTTCDDDKIYNNEVLIPMYKKYVLPTKKYADLLVDVENKNQLEVYQIVNNFLKNIGIL